MQSVNFAHDNRPCFHATNLEQASMNIADTRIARAADKAAMSVDAETIDLFRKYDIKLPARLAKGTWE